MEKPFSPSEAVCFIGGPRSGKTSALIERACAWAAPISAEADNAADPSAAGLLLFCASPATAAATAKRLEERGLSGASATTPLAYACRILAHPAARALTGRKPRLLTPPEEAVFYEDLKTCGLKRGRLRELWAFLQCGLANLDDGDPNWIQTSEERAVLDLAHSILHFQDGMLPAEAMNCAVRALEQDPALRRQFGSPVVLVDDYTLMSRASQRMASLLALDKIAVAGDDAPALPACEPYPCATGLAEFAADHAPVQTVRLKPLAPAARKRWEEAEDPIGEMTLIARTVGDTLAARGDARIAVVGTNAVWRANAVRALQAAGAAADMLPRLAPKAPGRGLRPPSERDCHHALAALAANPRDATLWRQCLSFDDALGRSAAISELRRASEPLGLNLVDALVRLDADDLPGLPETSPFAQSLLAPYRTIRAALDNGEDRPHAHTLQDEDASQVTSAPACPQIAVGTPRDLFGHTFDLVIFGGFVNGFIPSRDMCDPGVVVGGARERHERADRCAIARAAERAADELVFTGFSCCDLETAERLKLHIARIRLKDGERLCTIEPSSYLEELDLG